MPGGRTSRRHLLRLATGAVTLAALGAGAAGCRTDDGNQADDEQDTGRDKPGGDGDDVIKARRGGKDKVNCGKGEDRAVVDNKDKARKSCEKVRVR
jgi:hypothetical protein